MVAGLVAFGVTEGVDAQAAGGDPTVDPSASTAPSGGKPPGGAAKAGKRAAAKKGVKIRAKADPGLVATLPGFEMLPDGGSRLFVALTHAATVTEKRDARMLTYVIHGAHVIHRNNENALVTVHFNTPVTRARLLPARGDLVFSVDLRADSPAVWRMTDAGDGSSLLQIDFPRGAFLPAGEIDPASATVDPVADAARERAPGAAAPPATPPPPPAAPPSAAPGPASGN